MSLLPVATKTHLARVHESCLPFRFISIGCSPPSPQSRRLAGIGRLLSIVRIAPRKKRVAAEAGIVGVDGGAPRLGAAGATTTTTTIPSILVVKTAGARAQGLMRPVRVAQQHDSVVCAVLR